MALITNISIGKDQDIEMTVRGKIADADGTFPTVDISVYDGYAVHVFTRKGTVKDTFAMYSKNVVVGYTQNLTGDDEVNGLLTIHKQGADSVGQQPVEVFAQFYYQVTDVLHAGLFDDAACEVSLGFFCDADKITVLLSGA